MNKHLVNFAEKFNAARASTQYVMLVECKHKAEITIQLENEKCDCNMYFNEDDQAEHTMELKEPLYSSKGNKLLLHALGYQSVNL
jgi:Holliday junction resolvase